MGVDFAASWIQNGNTFNFVAPYGINEAEDGGISWEVPEEAFSGYDGAYQDNSFARPRDFTLHGTMNSTNPVDPNQLRNQFDYMAQWFTKGAAGKLYVPNSDRYLNCRVANFPPAETFVGFPNLKWRLGLRAGDPYFYDSTAQASLPLPLGTTTFTVGGSASALPIITVVVSETAAEWSVKLEFNPWVSNYLMTLPLSFTVPSTTEGGLGAGTYTIDCSTTPPRATFQDGTDVTNYVSGQMLELPTGSNQLTYSVATSIVGSGIPGSVTAAMQWTQRWLTPF